MAITEIAPIVLAPEVVDRLRDMEKDVVVLEQELARAKRAGIEISEIEKRFQDMKKLRVGLLREYT